MHPAHAQQSLVTVATNTPDAISVNKAAYYLTLLFVFVATGTISSLGPLGSVARVAAVPAICMTLLNVYLRGTCRRLNIYHWAFFLFILWNAATYFWSASPANTLYYGLARYLPLVATSLIVWENCRDHEKVDGVMQAFVCGGYMIVLTLSYNYISGNSAASDAQRVAAGGFHPDDFLYLIPVPVAWYLARRPYAKNKFWVLLNVGYVLAAPLGIVFTATRGALLVAVPGYLYVLWSGRRAPASWKIGFLVATVALVGVTSQLDVASKLTRLGTITESSSGAGSDSNFNGRGTIWSLAVKEFCHHPIIGIGSGAFTYVSLNDPIVGPMHVNVDEGVPAHNSYLSVLTETGIVGFLLLAFVVFIVVRSACSSKEPDLRQAFIAALTMMAVGVSSLTYEKNSGLWLLFTLIVVNANQFDMNRSAAMDPRLRRILAPVAAAVPRQKLDNIYDR